jgi:copper homeostasis protein
LKNVGHSLPLFEVAKLSDGHRLTKILHKSKFMLLEACVETFNEALLAQQKGAHRIELCARLDLDGLTPDADLIHKCCTKLSIPVVVMIRPREGNFIYNEYELRIMEQQIKVALKLGAAGVVTGLLTKHNQIDTENLNRLLQLTPTMQFTFHKAIDKMDDPALGVEQLLKVKGITHILSSGGKPTAMEGIAVLRKMLSKAVPKIEIIVAGKVTNENLIEIAALSGARAFHGRLIVGELV